MTYAQAIQSLYDLRWFGTKLGLTNTFRLAALAGDPQRFLRFIHVAGTNGKGSTCAMLESIYRAAGFRVGLFTSPHLVAFGERIQVNRRLISQAEVVKLVLEMQPLLAQFPAEEHPTFFEVVTVMALRYFAAQECDLVIWETGLGGRLDATNVVTPLASVITNIAYDHQQWLGETLADIAAEKAGIIKPGIPVISAVDDPQALPIIEETARRHDAPLIQVSRADADSPPLDTLELPLRGQHQRLNAGLAVATVRCLASHLNLPSNPMALEAILRAGLSKVSWPGRLQLVTQPSGQRVLLDGAHNVAGTETLAAALKEYFLAPPGPLTLVLGILRDKNWPAICRVLAPLAQRIVLTPVSSERTAGADELQQVCQRINPAAETVVCASAADALQQALDDSLVVVTGSLYLVGETLEVLGCIQAPAPERALNEWSAKA